MKSRNCLHVNDFRAIVIGRIEGCNCQSRLSESRQPENSYRRKTSETRVIHAL